MSFFSRISGLWHALTSRFKSAGERRMAQLMPNWGWMGGIFGGWSGNRLEQVQHLKGWPYIAIKAIYEEIAGMHPCVARVLQPDMAAKSKSLLPRRYRMKALAAVQEHEEMEPVQHNHPLAKLLRNPNGPDVAWNFFAKLVMYGELTGISYIWKVRNGLGLPCELWVIPSQWVRPFPDEKREKLIGYYEIRPYGMGARAAQFRVAPEDMITIAWPNPVNPLDGFSPFQAIAQWQDTAEAVDQSRFFEMRNGAHAGIVVKLDKEQYDPSEDTLDKFKADFRAKYQGVVRTGDPLIPPAGAEVSRLTATPEEMAYVPGADQLKTWLLAAYRVGASIVGLAENTNYASMVAARANFILSTIKPKLVYMGQVLTEKLAKEFDPDLVVYWPDVTPDDPAQKLAENVAYLAAGVKAVNEVRSEVGMEPYPHGGANPMMPMGVSEVPWAEAMPIEEGWSLPAAGMQGDEAGLPGESSENGNGHLSTEPQQGSPSALSRMPRGNGQAPLTKEVPLGQRVVKRVLRNLKGQITQIVEETTPIEPPKPVEIPAAILRNGKPLPNGKKRKEATNG